MTGLLALFTEPMMMPSGTWWGVIPASIVVAIVYKTVRSENVRRLPLEILRAAAYILAGEAALLVVGWFVLDYLV
ncbi:MAG: hypothetical protein GX591_07165 [Planctomycetes bacterium]|nr:hypothetical protein [Planctomycetota bacterium]